MMTFKTQAQDRIARISTSLLNLYSQSYRQTSSSSMQPIMINFSVLNLLNPLLD